VYKYTSNALDTLVLTEEHVVNTCFYLSGDVLSIAPAHTASVHKTTSSPRAVSTSAGSAVRPTTPSAITKHVLRTDKG